MLSFYYSPILIWSFCSILGYYLYKYNNHNAKILHILLQKYRKTLNNGRISPIFYNFAEKLNEFKRFSTFIHIKKA